MPANARAGAASDRDQQVPVKSQASVSSVSTGFRSVSARCQQVSASFRSASSSTGVSVTKCQQVSAQCQQVSVQRQQLSAQSQLVSAIGSAEFQQASVQSQQVAAQHRQVSAGVSWCQLSISTVSIGASQQVSACRVEVRFSDQCLRLSASVGWLDSAQFCCMHIPGLSSGFADSQSTTASCTAHTFPRVRRCRSSSACATGVTTKRYERVHICCMTGPRRRIVCAQGAVLKTQTKNGGVSFAPGTVWPITVAGGNLHGWTISQRIVRRTS